MFCSPEPEILTISKFTRNSDIVQIIPYCALKIHAFFYIPLFDFLFAVPNSENQNPGDWV
jgi:hypothetical protein